LVLQIMSDESDDDGDLLAGLARPNLGAMSAAPVEIADDDDDDDDEHDDNGDVDRTGQKAATGGRPPPRDADAGEEGSEEEDDEGDEAEAAFEGGVGATAAFELATAPDALELDPFRVAPGADVPDMSDAPAGDKKARAKGGGGAPIPRKIFVGGLAPGTTDAALVRFFARYGKVQEASAVQGGRGGAGRGFGFVTFVNDKGARYCLQQAGDPPVVDIEGRRCTVRYAETKDNHGARQHKMPARGNVDYLGLQKGRKRAEGAGGTGGSGASSSTSELAPHGIATIAQAHKRALPDGASGGGGSGSGSGAPAAGSSRSGYEHGGKRKKNEIVTVSKRQDAEPLNKKPITMKEIFPKEFWRI
jgi:hypothetical protein